VPKLLVQADVSTSHLFLDGHTLQARRKTYIWPYFPSSTISQPSSPLAQTCHLQGCLTCRSIQQDPMIAKTSFLNHLGGGLVIRAWDQEFCSLYGLRFEPCSCSYDGHWRLTWLLTSGPVGLVEVRASWPGHPR